MIVDVLDNAHLYYGLNKRLEKAFEYINSVDFMKLPCGRYEIDNDNIYVNVEEYLTKTESRPEYHKKYIDIQFVVSGEEKIGYCPLSEVNINEPFNEEKDIGFGSGKVSYIKMTKDLFMILMPQDAHQPCMAVNDPLKVKKIVVKVKID